MGNSGLDTVWAPRQNPEVSEQGIWRCFPVRTRQPTVTGYSFDFSPECLFSSEIPNLGPVRHTERPGP